MQSFTKLAKVQEIQKNFKNEFCVLIILGQRVGSNFTTSTTTTTPTVVRAVPPPTAGTTAQSDPVTDSFPGITGLFLFVYFSSIRPISPLLY